MLTICDCSRGSTWTLKWIWTLSPESIRRGFRVRHVLQIESSGWWLSSWIIKSTLITGLLLCQTTIHLISGRLSPMGVRFDQQCDPLPFFKCWYLYPYLACHVTPPPQKKKKCLKFRQNMPDIVDTDLLVLNQCSLRYYGWIFQTFAYFGNCCITGPCGTFSSVAVSLCSEIAMNPIRSAM